jgi:hypothetical protein
MQNSANEKGNVLWHYPDLATCKIKVSIPWRTVNKRTDRLITGAKWLQS